MCASKQKESLKKNPLKVSILSKLSLLTRCNFQYYSICSWFDPNDTRKIPEELCDLKGLLKLIQKKARTFHTQTHVTKTS